MWIKNLYLYFLFNRHLFTTKKRSCFDLLLLCLWLQGSDALAMPKLSPKLASEEQRRKWEEQKDDKDKAKSNKKKTKTKTKTTKTTPVQEKGKSG